MLRRRFISVLVFALILGLSVFSARPGFASADEYMTAGVAVCGARADLSDPADLPPMVQATALLVDCPEGQEKCCTSECSCVPGFCCDGTCVCFCVPECLEPPCCC